MRAWYLPDAEYKDQVMPKFNLVIKPDESAKFVMEDDEEFQYDMAIPFFDDNWLVEYSTGLFDRNGVEIFEGDIVKDGPNINVDFATVCWCRTWSCWEFRGEGHSVIDEFPSRLKYYIEVVGNIHQNKNLDKAN